MSKETMLHLNTLTLIGDTDKRGNAWHYRADLQGAESNHYPGAVPPEDVERRLYNWTAVPRRIAVEIPATLTDMTHLSEDGQPMKWAVQDDRQAIARSDDHYVMGVFKDGYEPHQYKEVLLDKVRLILDDDLHISSAGLLKQGAIAWVEVSVPDNFVTPEGVAFRPNLLSGTSFDGSLATFWKRTIQATVCDNTFEIARAEDGAIYKIKHTKNSGFKIAEARDALELVYKAADEFAAEVKLLCETEVTSRQWDAFLAEYAPIVDNKGDALKGRSLTIATNKQDELRRLWNNDNRVSPWKGTGFGVLQAANTYLHHSSTVKGATRPERNMLNAIKGVTAEHDQGVLDKLGKVLSVAGAA